MKLLQNQKIHSKHQVPLELQSLVDHDAQEIVQSQMKTLSSHTENLVPVEPLVLVDLAAIQGITGVRLSPRCTFMVMHRQSEYFTNLSADAKCQYEGKVTNSGLRQDPYATTEWTENPENVPEVQWSDLMLYMVTTPSPCTPERKSR